MSTKHEHKSGDELPPFTVGPGPEQRTRIYDVAHPVKRGAISDWVAYEQLMFSCLCECAPLGLYSCCHDTAGRTSQYTRTP